MRIPPWVVVGFRHLHQALLEFGFLFVFGLMPLWLGAIFQGFFSKDPVRYLNGYLLNGEALLLSAVTIGPLLYTVVASDFGVPKDRRHFPMKGWYLLIVAVICIVSAGMLGLKAALGDRTVPFSSTFVWWTSTSISAISVILWFAISGTVAVRSNGAAAIMREDEHEFVRDYNK